MTVPTYEYRCEDCGFEFELFQSMTASVKRKCPQCGEPKLKRLIGAGAGVIFKGSGFHETDYRSESYKKGAEAEKKASEPKKEKKYKKKNVKPGAAKGSSTVSKKEK